MFVKAVTFAVVSASCSLARAQFAIPPDAPTNAGGPGYALPPPEPESSFRARVGPALRVNDAGTAGGLATAIDVGKYAGLRLSAIWTQVGPLQGNGQYGADLWLNLAPGAVLGPVMAAGAAWVHTDGEPLEDGERDEPHDFGVATVRAGLEYSLGLSATDARIALEALGSVPAISAQDRRPWLTFVSSLALGF